MAPPPAPAPPPSPRPPGSLGPSTWIPWCYAMCGAIVLFALNGIYQHKSWWVKGGQDTLYTDVDPLARLPSTTSSVSRFGGSFQVCLCVCVGGGGGRQWGFGGAGCSRLSCWVSNSVGLGGTQEGPCCNSPRSHLLVVGKGGQGGVHVRRSTLCGIIPHRVAVRGVVCCSTTNTNFARLAGLSSTALQAAGVIWCHSVRRIETAAPTILPLYAAYTQ